MRAERFLFVAAGGIVISTPGANSRNGPLPLGSGKLAVDVIGSCGAALATQRIARQKTTNTLRINEALSVGPRVILRDVNKPGRLPKP